MIGPQAPLAPWAPQLAAAPGAGDPLAALIGLFVLFAGAKLGEEVARRLHQPAVIGELLGGWLVGPHALGLVTPGETAAVFSELGVVILLFAVGLEVRVDDLLAVGRPALASAVLAMVLPIAGAAAVALGAGAGLSTAAFVGLALAATSIGVTSRVLADMGVLHRRYARIILGAAIADDVLALILIGFVSGFATGDVSASTVLVAVAGLGLVGLGFLVARRVRGLPREAFTWPRFADSPLVPAFMLMLAAALLTAQLGLAAIVGAFLAGLIVAETQARSELEREMRPLQLIFVPFFFAAAGSAADLSTLLHLETLGLVALLTLVGVVTKVLGGYLGARGLGARGALVVGAGLVPRGEVGIVVANLGSSLGLLDADLFSAVLVAVVLTTLLAPLLLTVSVSRAERSPRGSSVERVEGTPRAGPGGSA